MSLFVAAIEIGKAIAKSVFKLWVKDSDLGNNTSSSLIDLIASKTSDTLAQRKGNRQFEDIGDKVGENIFPLLESENISLNEGERRVVGFAVAETLNKARFTRNIFLQHNLQPSQLEKLILATHPQATRDFSANGISLYRILIKEACKYIIDISSHLPSFSEYTFSEILKREDMIRFKVDQVLDELRKMQAYLDSADFEREYREAVTRNLDILNLIGADVSFPNRRHKLSIAYITLSVSRKLIPSAINSILPEVETSEELLGYTVAADVALASTSRLLIRGDAGSGKTTLMQWLAVNAAKRSFEGNLASWNGCVPFYIRLRQYATERLPQPEKFPELAAPAIIGTMPSNWVHAILRSGRALLLIDGVDELSSVQRDEVHTWLQDLVATYKDCRFIVTSRPYAIKEGWMNHEAFQEASLQEMTLQDIHLFIDHWHEAVKAELLTDEEKKESSTLAESLKIQITQTRAIRNLATNPLLCSMLCALNREHRGMLPINRIELYKACCILLLERLEKESRIDLSDYPDLQYSQKERLLSDIAYLMTKENLSEIEVTRIDASFTHRLEHMPNISSNISGKAVRRFFVERTGILREPALGKIDFFHRAFQELFAAQAALAAADIEYLVNNAHLDQWREVVILAAGLATEMQCEQLITALILRGDNDWRLRHQLHLIAISCLETAVTIKPEIRAEVEKRLTLIIPPKNMTEAKTLSAAGELAIKHLHKKELEKKKKLSATVCAACIRTLSLIGGETALDIIEGYKKDAREVVINELLKEWDLFDKKLYAHRVLSSTVANLNNLADLYKSQEKYTQAQALYIQALKIQEVLFGTEHSFIINNLNNLADLYMRQGKYTQAEPLYVQVLTIQEHQLGFTHPDTIQCLNNLANFYIKHGKDSQAEPLLVHALNVLTEVLGPDHPDTANISYNLASLHTIQNKKTEVQSFFEDAGFMCKDLDEPISFLVIPTIAIWQKKIKHPIYIRILTGKRLNGTDVSHIHDTVKGISKEITLAFAIVDKSVDDYAWLQIAALRANNFNVIPLPFTLFTENQTLDKTMSASTILDKHLERFLGQGTDPYNIRHPIFDVLNFFGREALAHDLIERMNSGNSIGLFGLRKMGKSSLMQYTRRLMPCPTAYLDLQAGIELTSLYKRLLYSWYKDATTRLKIDLNLPHINLDAQDLTAEFVKITQTILDRITSRKQEARLAIFLDEIESIVPPINAAGATLEHHISLMRTLRGLAQEDGRILLMVAGVDPTINHISRWGDEQKQNPFFMLLEEFYLPPLFTSDCVQMIRNIGTQVKLSYSEEAAAYVAQMSGGHPYLARQLCSLAYRQRHQQKGELTQSTMKQAAERFLFDPQYASSINASGLWGEITNIKLWGEEAAKANQEILFMLAQSTEPIAESIITNGTNQIALRSALFSLKELSVIHSIKHPINSGEPYYAISFGLFHSWIRRVRFGLEG